MKTGGATAAALLLLATLVIQESIAEDIYWEGENGAEDEFLEVKEETVLARLKRGLLPDWFEPWKTSFSPSTESPENYETVTEDQDDSAEDVYDNRVEGSGITPDRIEPDPTEKTLRVTFGVMEPFHDDYSNRDSETFKSFSHNLAEAVNALFINLPGTQKASLVRIQSRLADSFSCKVTLDIVTTVDNTEEIAELLRVTIRNTRHLGPYTLTETDFSHSVVKPGSPFDNCQPNEVQCKDGTCVAGTAICDGVKQCPDGADERDCPETDQNQNLDDFVYHLSPNRPRCANPTSCQSSSITFCPEQRCDGKKDCPLGEDEDFCSTPGTPEREKQPLPTAAPVDETTTERPEESDADQACFPEEFRCDETRCITKDKVCDRVEDCSDGTDEANCVSEQCGRDDFICSNGKCIESSKRCNRIADCPGNEDEANCQCTQDEFRCHSDSSCIEGWKHCDNTVHCQDGSDELGCNRRQTCRQTGQFRCGDGKCISIMLRCDGFRDCRSDGSDEFDCPCTPDQWQCDEGNCIKRNLRCNGRVDCPSDRSDERNCVAIGYFKCKTGKVIPDILRCNHQYDCPPGDYSDEHNCPCGDNDFKCHNGHCIQAYKHCDKTNDCQDGSDELQCNYGTECMAYEFKCASGQCVHAEAPCNGSTECGDGSDESNCPCKRGQFRCRDGACINIVLRCNSQIDCSQGEDELNCGLCSSDAFTCPDGSRVQCAVRCDGRKECTNGEDEDDCDNGVDDCFHPCDGKCLEEIQICDTIADCLDGSDEISCEKCDGPDDFSCADGDCIKRSGRCNNIYDCNDQSDEIGCNVTMTPKPEGCSKGQFQCADGTCVNGDFVCDKVTDCVDGTDELNCPWLMARASRASSPVPCLGSEFTCYNGWCIPMVQRCDNIYDCSDFSDEQKCLTACADDEFPCTNRKCVSATSRCDGFDDCGDGTDEYACEDQTTESYRWPSTTAAYSGAETPRPTYSPYSPRRPGNQPSTSNYPYPTEAPRYYPYGRRTDNPNARPGSDSNYNPTEAPRYDPYGRPDNNPNARPGSDSNYNPTEAPRYDPYGRPDNNPNARPGSDSNYNPTEAPRYDPYGRPDNNPNARPGSDSNYNPTEAPRYDPYGRPDNNPNARPGSDSNYPYSTEAPKYDAYGRPIYNPNARPGSDNQSGGGSYSGSQGGGYPYPSGSDSRQGNGNPDQNGSATGQGGQPGSYPASWDDQNNNNEGSRQDQDNSLDGGSDDSDNDNYGNPSNIPPTAPPTFPGARRYPGSSNSDGGSARGASVACKYYEWRCENGPCIDERRRCDGHIDCPFDFSDEFDCPAGSPVALKVKTYPEEQSVRFGGDVVFQCRDESLQRANVNWVREGGRAIKPGFRDERGRLEIEKVTMADAGIYICQASQYLGRPGSEVRVTLVVEPAATTKTPFVPCQQHEATCHDGQCIPKSSICNGIHDCADRSDEDMCQYNGKCEPNQFQCENRKCVLKSWLCDSDDDCGDGSDEKNCLNPDPSTPCSPVEFACHSQSQCIPKSFQCDSRNDCFDGSDEIGCTITLYFSQTATPPLVKLNAGETLILTCQAVGVPEPLISWRRNWGHVPDKCTWTNRAGVGNLTCPDMQVEDRGAYSCEAVNLRGTSFAYPDSIVFVQQNNVCPSGYFNDAARSQSECIRCFCFDKSTQCRSADLYTYYMPTPLGEGGTRLVGVTLSGDGQVRFMNSIASHYYYQSMANGVSVSRLAGDIGLGSFHPFLTLPESYNGVQLTSYGGYIKYSIVAQTNAFAIEDEVPAIIIKGKYVTLFNTPGRALEPRTEIKVRLTPGNWDKSGPNGYLIPATREDIMIALDDIEMILLRADYNNAGVNITNFVMESAQDIDSELGRANLVEECICPEGYDGLSCQKCKPGYVREKSGQWLGKCVRKQCPPGTYGDPSIGDACKPCPCPLTNRDNQFATTCSIGPDGDVVCDCQTGYEGRNCERCSPGFLGNPMVPGDKCRVPPSDNCNPIGTRYKNNLNECICKDNVQGRYCDQCKNGTFYLSDDFSHGCASCFCSGEPADCMSSNLRRKTTEVNFNVPGIVNEVKVFRTSPQGNNFRYTAPVETELKPILTRSGLALTGLDRSRPTVYYWSLPKSFAGDKVTAYGGYLKYTLENVPTAVASQFRNKAADIQLLSDNNDIYQYVGDFIPTSEGQLSVSVQLVEKGWVRSDGKDIPRELFLLSLADVNSILIKATYSTDSIATPIYASIETAAADGDGPAALHVEQCACPPEHIGTSCEDCAPGYTRGPAGLYLAHCVPCECNHHSKNCHPETGQCYECLDNSDGPHCELCKEGYERDDYDNTCVPYGEVTAAPTCRCDPNGIAEPCYDDGACSCKRNVEGETCDRCRVGAYGLTGSNPDGCSICFCSGVTRDCHEAKDLFRQAIPAPILTDSYGGYTIMDIMAERVINDHFVPYPDRSELQFNFDFEPIGVDYYWSLPYTGNHVLSYGGNLYLTQKFESNDGEGVPSVQGNDVILVGDGISIAWVNPNPLTSGTPATFHVPLQEENWTILNTADPADRIDFMRVLKNLRRMLVKATLVQNIVSTFISDVSLETATKFPSATPARGVEVCSCPPGHFGTSCENCVAGYYKNDQDYCERCPCNGHDCQVNSRNEIVCSCRPPFTGNDCSANGLLMELHPSIRDDQNVIKQVALTCKYRAPEPLTIKFVVEGKDYGPVLWANESTLHPDGWHGQHVVDVAWDTRERKIFECRTITQRGLILGVLFTDFRNPEGSALVTTTTRLPPVQSTVTVRITSPSGTDIIIKEIGSSVNFTCQASSPYTRRLYVEWYKADGELALDRTITNPNTGIIIINNLQITDSGKYICESHDGTSTGQDYVTLKVPGNPLSAPNVEIRPPFQEVYAGERIELECLVSGSPQPTVSWQRASRRPLPNSATLYNSMLIIENARKEDSGEYICIGSNSVGSNDRTAFITVRPRPSRPQPDRLIVSPTTPAINEGQSLNVVCTGSVNVPAGTIDWVRQDGDRFQANVRASNGVLYIEEAVPENAGVYICQTQGAEVEPESVLVTVISTPKPSGEAPEVTVVQKQVSIPSGESTKVDCIPRGNPLPRIKWRKYEGEFGRGVSQRGNSLLISEAEDSDTAYYVCDGIDQRGDVVGGSVYVYIEIEKREKPVAKMYPEEEQPVLLGDTQFEFRCIVTGIPEPVVTWSRAHSRPLSPHARIRPNNILQFDKIEVNDEGEYICTGDNKVGSASASGVIRVRSPPQIVITPTDFFNVNVGSSVTVNCKAEGYPEPFVTIKGPDGHELVTGSRVASLRLQAASERDEGRYTCEATSEAGTRDESFMIRVEAPDRGDIGADEGGYQDTPKPNLDHEDDGIIVQNVAEGSELNIHCNVTNGYNPRWSRDNMPLQNNARQIGNKLTIYNIAQSDGGLYTCSAINHATREIQVALYTRINVVSPVKASIWPRERTVHPGESPTVECIVEGDNVIDVKWSSVGKNFSRRVLINDRTLMFQYIEAEDAGTYNCLARGIVNNATATVEVTVLEESIPASSESHEHEQWVRAGAGVVLSCNASGETNVTWTKDDRPITSSSILTKPDGSLHIRLALPAHSGHYVCHIRDSYGRQTSNYINLHIDGDDECLDSEFRCTEDGNCIDVSMVCDNSADCTDGSDEENCFLRDKRYSADEREALVHIVPPHRAFRVGENVEVQCKSAQRDITVEWIREDAYGKRQYVDFNIYGDGAVLVIRSVGEHDAGAYKCVGNRYGQNYTDSFYLEIVPGSGSSNLPERNVPTREYKAQLGSAIDLPCNHNLEEPVSFQWRREFITLPDDIRTNQPMLRISNVSETDAGTYLCRASNSRTTAEYLAMLRVKGVIPRFNGQSWLALPALADAYRQFDIQVSFKPTDTEGLIFYNSASDKPDTDFIALRLISGIPEFTIETGHGPVSVRGDRPLTPNEWHKIHITKLANKVTMNVDQNGPFEKNTEFWILELSDPLYIGGVSNPNQLPEALYGATGFVGCISSLILGQKEKNLMIDNTEMNQVQNCDTCAAHLCESGGDCQEARNDRGYVCLCRKDFAGENCERRGTACRAGICGPGRCTSTFDGYKCDCPVTHTGRNCETQQQVDYPGFSGTGFIAMKAPETVRYLQMSMKVKPNAPVTDGIIMYCAESPRGIGGFTSLAVKNGKLEFRYDLGQGSAVVLVGNRTLMPNEWTDVQVTRSGTTVSLNIHKTQNYEKNLDSARSLTLDTPMFVGGVDESITLNSNTGVTGGFMGCIKDLKTQNIAVDIVNDPNLRSSNVQDCANMFTATTPRGDIPEAEFCRCNNGGSCAADGSCICPPNFVGPYCERRAPSPRNQQRSPSDPCAAHPCRNGGTCRPDYSNQMNHTCDCLLGFAGPSCQLRLELKYTVGFQKNGYLELPASLVDYSNLEVEPVIIALRASTIHDGVMLYQRETRAAPDEGDYLLIRVEHGHVVVEWDFGSGMTSLSVNPEDGRGFVADGELHMIVVQILPEGIVNLSVDGLSERGISNGFASTMNADSNIYIGGIPDWLNVNGFDGLIGCIDQVEFMDTGHGVNLGTTAVAGRNTQLCRK